MRRVVITGMGIVSSIGNNKQEVTESSAHQSHVLHIVRMSITWAEDHDEYR